VAAGGAMSKMLGLGFVFGAKDEGAVRTTTALSEGFDSVVGAVRSVASSSNARPRVTPL
jgi:hypothetical protein